MELMQVDAEENENMDDAEFQVENCTIDIDSYASSYSGLTLLHRLIFIADHCRSLKVEALRLALASVLETHNVTLYQRIHTKLAEANSNLPNLPDAVAGQVHTLPAFDMQWFESTTKRRDLKLEKLDTDLKNYRSNSIKESIRRGHDDLGDHYLDAGDLNNALRCYSRTRDYCTNGKHVISMCLNVIQVSIHLRNWSHVTSYVNKADSTPSPDGESHTLSIATQLKCAAGLAELATGKFKSAAKLFLQANFEHCHFPKLISPNNVAVYGSLCALATFDRKELERHVISSSGFKLFLELEPQLRDVLQHFHGSKYAKCLSLLDQMKDNMLLDLYLSPHVNALYEQIRKRALRQYFSPYSSADMVAMAIAFNTTVPNLEEEIMQLILDDQINARIDSHNKVLLAKDINERTATFERALEMGKSYEQRSKALILRAAILRAEICVKNNNRDGSSEGSVPQSAMASSRN